MSKATRRFIVNKVLEMLITLVVVTLISFLLVRLSPIAPLQEASIYPKSQSISALSVFAGRLPYNFLKSSGKLIGIFVSDHSCYFRY